MTNMPAGEERKLSNQDIQLVQNRIEQCLQHYMSKKEVINSLLVQDNIQPGFTELVWQRLEEENQEFFKAYYLKLLVKDQIMEFNRLLSEQVELMHRIGLSGIGPVLPSNGSHVSPSQRVPSSSNPRPVKLNEMQPVKVLNDVGPMLGSCMAGPIPIGPPSQSMFLPQNANLGLAQLNGKIVKTEGGGGGYGGVSQPFDFGPNRNYVEMRPNMMADPSVSSFSSVDSNAHHINETTLLDGGDASSFGFLAQFQQNMSLPEFGSDFPGGSDLLESYCRPGFLGADANNFVDPHVNVESLDPETGSLRFQCFGSN
ncbi:hypothetical protein STAS_28004 [Striga asiatica]|uniref:Uncharacterized protein n=1 Tax=Striga asiatica TaxID=4170 RepID=A0A5A7R033_STRAF|nr:hypothetical protein STAS_28004 [Striga asiatica]